MSMHLNLGNGKFDDPIFFRTVEKPCAIRIGDINSDKRVDIIVKSFDELAVHFNTGIGTFTEENTYVFRMKGHHFTTGDMDGNDEVDIIIENATSIIIFFTYCN